MSPASASHPRRRAARAASPAAEPSLVDSFQCMSIQKGETFHPKTSTGNTTEFWDPLESSSTSPAGPPRGTTCPKSLEDLLIGSGDRRVVELMARVEKSQSPAALGRVLSDPEVLPKPSFSDEQSSAEDDERSPRKTRAHSHSSDSGIGSSIMSDEAGAAKTSTDTSTTEASSSDIPAATGQRGLSKYACEQIYKHIVGPILREESLKDFHSLVQDVPSRIGKKEIRTLRDLEKTLVFLAPDYSRSPYKYLHFCEATIRVLHTTVTTLHESDQRAPTDRPYTQGYFFDLIDQIRRYATILAATREKKEKGEELDELDYASDESVSLMGGMTHNGRPAEIVRHKHKEGKFVSLATDQVMTPEEAAVASMKRPLQAEDEDDEAVRSMARRKKGAKPEIHECSLCDKEFKRPCDLTKHLKTHERPWKCPIETCKYHEHGWPTEKERDRHANDKHSSAPSLYHCLFKPCPYTSKRESNCKQHMEKAHGWSYVRSKNNGKGRASITRLQRGSNPQSPVSSVLTPSTPYALSPSIQSTSNSETSRNASMPPPPLAGPSNWNFDTYMKPSTDFNDHFNMDFDFNNMMEFPTSTMFPITPSTSDDRHHSVDTGSSSGFQLDGSAFDDGISPADLTYKNFDFNDIGLQQFTPDSDVAPLPTDTHNAFGFPHTSPGAQLEQTFTHDAMNVDTTTDYSSAGAGYGQAPAGDFTLFGSQPAHSQGGGEMFQPLSQGAAAASWGNFGGVQFDPSHPSMPTGSSAVDVDALFPELKEAR